MTFIHPNMDWYLAKSKENGLMPRCPFTDVHSCPRHYATTSMLGNNKIISKMDSNTDRELEQKWSKTNLWPVTQEQDTGITLLDTKIISYHNLCPEIAYDTFGLFACYLHEYNDEIDRETAEKYLAKKGKSMAEDWRWTWSSVQPLHYSECHLFSKLSGVKSVETSKKQIGF